MTTIKYFLYDLKNQDIQLWLDGDSLRCNAPKGALTAELRTELANRKAEIIVYLQQHHSEPKIIPVNRDTNIPLSYAQARLWFLEQLESGKSTNYNLPNHLKIVGSLNTVALEQSLGEIVRRHEVLRTNFRQVNGLPIQVINPKNTFTLPVIELQNLLSVEQSAEVEKLINEDNQKPFNLATDPLIRATLLQLGHQYYILLLTFHHIVFDAWSAGIFIKELSSLYQAYLQKLPSPLPDLPIQYADFAVWQQQWLSGEVLETQLNYWKEQLANLPPLLELPTDKPRYLVQTSRGSKQKFTLNFELTQKLKDLSRQSGATLFMILLAAFATLLHRYSTQEDIVIGSPAAWMMLDAFPLTNNGKIDYRALTAPTQELSSSHNLVTPRTPTQELIVDIIAIVLRREIGIHDNFFELGGHSLLAMQVISRLRETFKVDLPLRCLFESPTVAELAEAILKEQQGSGKKLAPAIIPRPRNTAQIPLSFVQSRLWFLNQLEGISGTYNIAVALQITGNLNIKALEQAIQKIVERHEILRTYFHSINGSPVQVIDPKINVTLSVVDVPDDSTTYFSRDLENLSPNLSPTRREALNSPPSLLEKEVGGLGFALVFPHDVKSQINPQGNVYNAGYAPYLNYRPLTDEERGVVETVLEESWLREELEAKARSYAIAHLVPQHLQEVRQPKEELIAKTMAAVKDRLTKEINYWDHRAEELKMQEEAGKPNAKINSAKARQRADELQTRLLQRLEELEQERRLSPLPPVVIGGALVVSAGLLQKLQGKQHSAFAQETQRVEREAMAAVMDTERRLGYEPRDVSHEKCGYDIESRSLTPNFSQDGRRRGGEGLRFIEVKGRITGADTLTVTKNEIITALNKPENFILALVQVPLATEIESSCSIRYLRRPFQKEPDFAVTSVNYNLRELWQQGTEP